MALSGAVIDPNQTLEHCEDNGGWLCGEVETHVSENGLDVVDLVDQQYLGWEFQWHLQAMRPCLRP